MYQLTIATAEGVRTTRHADADLAGRAPLLDYAKQADVYLHGDDRNGGHASGATDLTIVALLQLDPAGRRPRCVGTATITATATVAPTTNSLTGVAAS